MAHWHHDCGQRYHQCTAPRSKPLRTISYLLLERLDSDTITIAYDNAGVASASLPLAELPSETPAFASGLAGFGPF